MPASARQRPQVHFTAASGWINDPYGVSYREGTYHVFFQYVPGQTSWALGCHWGHASSPDLLTWTEHPPVLGPGDGDDGVWSGSVVQAEAGAQAFYTSVRADDLGHGRIRRATPVGDDCFRWSKHEIVVEPPSHLDVTAFRDPFVFRDTDRWRMLVGTSLAGEVGAASAYSSSDLRTWTYDGLAAQRASSDRADVWTGSLWECPQIFALDGRHVLVTSVSHRDLVHYAAYAIGDYEDGRFVAERWRPLTFGRGYYAPSFFTDAQGRACLVLWMSGGDEQAGWAGALSVPHQLRLDGDALTILPHPSVRGAVPETRTTGTEVVRVDRPQLITWTGEPGDTLDVHRDGHLVLVLSQSALWLQIFAAGKESSVPAVGPVTVLVDGPCIEIWTAAGLWSTIDAR